MIDSESNIHRALKFQGGGSLGAYEARAYKAINEELSALLRNIGKGKEPIFHIIAGTSVGVINAPILVSYVKESKTWEGSGTSWLLVAADVQDAVPVVFDSYEQEDGTRKSQYGNSMDPPNINLIMMLILLFERTIFILYQIRPLIFLQLQSEN